MAVSLLEVSFHHHDYNHFQNSLYNHILISSKSYLQLHPKSFQAVITPLTSPRIPTSILPSFHFSDTFNYSLKMKYLNSLVIGLLMVAPSIGIPLASEAGSQDATPAAPAENPRITDLLEPW